MSIARSNQTDSRHCFEPQELRDLAYLICESGRPVGSSSADLLGGIGADASRLSAIRKKLESHGSLKRLVSPDRSEPADDLLVLSNKKRVSVSPEGNRGVAVGTEAMTLKDGVTNRVIGGIVWRKEMPAPKWRMESILRSDPLQRTTGSAIEWKILKNEKNALTFELLFKPPLKTGETVDYGFYVWNRRHYAMTRGEAERRYRDKWVREGVAVRGPTDWLQITAQLPAGFRVQVAHLEKDPILNVDGPNVPGQTIQKVSQHGNILETVLHCPSSGRYFLSWIPPERWRPQGNSTRFYHTE